MNIGKLILLIFLHAGDEVEPRETFYDAALCEKRGIEWLDTKPPEARWGFICLEIS